MSTDDFPDLWNIAQSLGDGWPLTQFQTTSPDPQNDTDAAAVQRNAFSGAVSFTSSSGTPSALSNLGVLDLYLVTTNLHFDSYAGVVHDSDSKRGPYLKSVELRCATMFQGAGAVTTYESIPATYSSDRQETSSIGGSLTGSVGVFGDSGIAQLTGGASFSKSMTVDEPDIAIENLCDGAGVACWRWTFRSVGVPSGGVGEFFGEKLEHMVPKARTACDLEASWVWWYKRPDPDTTPFSYEASLTVQYEMASLDWPDVTHTTFYTASPLNPELIRLPTPPAPPPPTAPSKPQTPSGQSAG